MRIDNYERLYGAALMQIVEDPSSPSVRAMKLKARRVSDAFQVNDDICICFKYASKTGTGASWGGYAFTFNSHALAELRRVQAAGYTVWLGLICVGGREICCVSLERVLGMIEERRLWMTDRCPERDADACVLRVGLKPGKYFRIGIDRPWMLKKVRASEHKIPRKAFPRDMLYA